MKRILLVDDEPMVLRVMRFALEKEGYDVTVAVDGLDAMEKLAEQAPDVLITDIEMPRMDGKKLCQHIQQSMPDREFPIFIATSLTALEHRDWSNKIPRLVFLEKPVSIRKLRAAIAESAAIETAPAEPAEKPVEAKAEAVADALAEASRETAQPEDATAEELPELELQDYDPALHEPQSPTSQDDAAPDETSEQAAQDEAPPEAPPELSLLEDEETTEEELPPALELKR